VGVHFASLHSSFIIHLISNFENSYCIMLRLETQEGAEADQSDLKLDLTVFRSTAQLSSARFCLGLELDVLCSLMPHSVPC
jgi:hypothetical protein